MRETLGFVSKSRNAAIWLLLVLPVPASSWNVTKPRSNLLCSALTYQSNNEVCLEQSDGTPWPVNRPIRVMYMVSSFETSKCRHLDILDLDSHRYRFMDKLFTTTNKNAVKKSKSLGQAYTCDKPSQSPPEW
jgi:hypothetical protein